MGASRFSLAMGREWPWVARIRWCDGLLVEGKGEKGGEVDKEGEGGGVGSGMRAKRCLAFVSTIDLSSANVTERVERRAQDSYLLIWGAEVSFFALRLGEKLQSP